MALTRKYADVVRGLGKSCAPVPQASAQLKISKDSSLLRKNYTTPKNDATPGNTTRATSLRGTTGDKFYMNMRTTSIVIKDLRKSAAPVLQANPVRQPKVSKDKRKNRKVFATSNRLRCSDESADATDACKPKPEGRDDRDVVVSEKERPLDDEQKLAKDEVLDEALIAKTNADEENWQVATAFAENLVAETIKHVLEDLKQEQATARESALTSAADCIASHVLDSAVDELKVEEAAAEAAHRTAYTAAENVHAACLSSWEKGAAAARAEVSVAKASASIPPLAFQFGGMQKAGEESLEDVLDASSNLSREEEHAVDEVLDELLGDITSDEEVVWQAAAAFAESHVQTTMEHGFVDLKQDQAAARGSEDGCTVCCVLDSIVDELEVEEAAAEAAAHRTACTAAENACTANLIRKAWEKKADQVVNNVLLHTLHLIWAKATIAAHEEQNARRRQKSPGSEDYLIVKCDCVEGLRSVVQDMLREGEVAHVPESCE